MFRYFTIPRANVSTIVNNTVTRFANIDLKTTVQNLDTVVCWLTISVFVHQLHNHTHNFFVSKDNRSVDDVVLKRYSVPPRFVFAPVFLVKFFLFRYNKIIPIVFMKWDKLFTNGRRQSRHDSMGVCSVSYI